MRVVTEAWKEGVTGEACDYPSREALDEAKRRVQRTMTGIRHNIQDTAAEAALVIRRHPLRTVGLGLCAGAMTGALIGLAMGWYWKARD